MRVHRMLATRAATLLEPRLLRGWALVGTAVTDWFKTTLLLGVGRAEGRIAQKQSLAAASGAPSFRRAAEQFRRSPHPVVPR
jgi:hypothetical protein